MATIIKFEPRASTGHSRDDRRDGGPSGEVVIFPGVRIERQEFLLSDRLTGSDPDKSGMGRRARSK